MSHFTTIKTQIKDIHALRSACQVSSNLPDAEARGYNGASHRGEFIIRLKGLRRGHRQSDELWPDHRLVGRSRQRSRQRLR